MYIDDEDLDNKPNESEDASLDAQTAKVEDISGEEDIASSEGHVIVTLDLPSILAGWDGSYSLKIIVPDEGEKISQKEFIEALLACYNKLSMAVSENLTKEKAQKVLLNFRRFWERNQHLPNSFWESPESARRVSADFADSVNGLLESKPTIDVQPVDFADVITLGGDENDSSTESDGDA